MATEPRFTKLAAPRRRVRRGIPNDIRPTRKLPPLKMATTGLQLRRGDVPRAWWRALIVGAAIGLSPKDLTFLTGACLFRGRSGDLPARERSASWKIGARLCRS